MTAPTSEETPRFPFLRENPAEPPGLYARLRTSEPVKRVEMPNGAEAWLVTKYEDVRLVLNDRRFSRTALTEPDAPLIVPLQRVKAGIINLDPPEHTRLRRVVSPPFRPRSVEPLRAHVQEVTDGLLDRMEEEGAPADLVEKFATPLPIMIICQILGVPYEDRDQFRAWADTVLSLTSRTPEEIVSAREALLTYCADLVAAKRTEPTDDLLSAVIRQRDEAGSLSEDELVTLPMTLLLAGYETIANQLACGVLTLLRHPDRSRELREDASLIPAAVEELVRLISLGGAAPLRRTTEDVELSGTVIPAGSVVLVGLGSANRDEQQFENGDLPDFRRPENQHVGFGGGPHHCLGAHLARIELQVAIGSLVTRFPDLRLAVPEEELPWSEGQVMHSLLGLPVTW